jgi:hypothetical protein
VLGEAVGDPIDPLLQLQRRKASDDTVGEPLGVEARIDRRELGRDPGNVAPVEQPVLQRARPGHP